MGRPFAGISRRRAVPTLARASRRPPVVARASTDGASKPRPPFGPALQTASHFAKKWLSPQMGPKPRAQARPELVDPLTTASSEWRAH